MQVQIDFSTDNLNLPISYNSIVQGFIYNTLLKVNPVYSGFIHNKGQEHGKNDIKLFTFGRLEGEYRIKGKEIIFPRTATLEVRSADDNFITAFYNGCHKGETVKLGHNYVKIEDCTLHNRSIKNDSITVFTKSPFTFHSEFEERYVFDKEKVINKLISNAKRKWISAGFNEDDFRLEIDFDSSVPQPVHCIFKTTYNIAWNCTFRLNGSIETLDFLYNTGIGTKNSQGFGMFECKNESF